MLCSGGSCQGTTHHPSNQKGATHASRIISIFCSKFLTSFLIFVVAGGIFMEGSMTEVEETWEIGTCSFGSLHLCTENCPQPLSLSLSLSLSLGYLHGRMGSATLLPPAVSKPWRKKSARWKVSNLSSSSRCPMRSTTTGKGEQEEDDSDDSSLFSFCLMLRILLAAWSEKLQQITAINGCLRNPKIIRWFCCRHGTTLLIP